MRSVTVVHGKKRYRIYVYSIPTTGHTLRLLPEGAAEPILLEVRTVLYEVGVNGRTRIVELWVRRRGNLAAPTSSIIDRFWSEVEWPPRTTLPCIGDSIRLPSEASINRTELRVCEVIHDIDQVGKKQAIRVQFLDASPKQIFSDEVIQRAHREDIEPLFDE
jgi:hypothetical protein